ncbi:30S ribosomal protein S8e [Candidatus Pacearchaeota archaeon]|nr:30S ribosomal protein S8e [Candidatus Pacearchaeota archaeon]
MKTGRKITGGKYHRNRKKKFIDRKGQPRIAFLKDETKRKQIRTRSGYMKTILLSTNNVNLSIKGKVQNAKIKNVLQTPQNVFLARQNILFKGAIIETSLGKARITNRPSQEGQVNAVLLEE